MPTHDTSNFCERPGRICHGDPAVTRVRMKIRYTKKRTTTRTNKEGNTSESSSPPMTATYCHELLPLPLTGSSWFDHFQYPGPAICPRGMSPRGNDGGSGVSLPPLAMTFGHLLPRPRSPNYHSLLPHRIHPFIQALPRKVGSSEVVPNLAVRGSRAFRFPARIDLLFGKSTQFRAFG